MKSHSQFIELDGKRQAGIGSEFGLSRRGGYAWTRKSRSGPTRAAPITLTSNGRVSLTLAARYARNAANNQRNTVLLPSYLCDSMIQPFLELGLRVRFYPLTGDLLINQSEICSRIDDHTLAVMLMHYFGFRQSGDPAALLANKFPHVTIIEDHSHLLLSDMHAGTLGSDSSIVVYSARKWGPFPDLGIVVWRRLGSPGELKDFLLVKGYDWSFGFWRLSCMLLRSLFFAFPIEAFRRLSLWPLVNAEATLDRRVKPRKASPVSQWLWRYWDWMPVWHTRRQNFQYLLDNWPSTEMKPLFPKLPETVCPLAFPTRTPHRDTLQQYFASKGVFLPVHWSRPPQVAPDEFPEAARLAEQELTIPIDQRYGLRHMDYILEAISHA